MKGRVAWPRCRQRGAALLLVLATLVLVVTACATLARVAGTRAIERRADAQSASADALLREAERAVQRWLSRDADEVALPPDAARPEVTLLREVWRVGDVDCALDISAWDQCGLVPITLSRPGSPLRASIPETIAAQVDERMQRGSIDGLDLFVRPMNASPFPHAGNRVPAVGAQVATHSAATLPALNVNTAPRARLAAALRMLGRGGLEQIVNARAEGRQADLNEDGGPLRLVSRSDAWSFRIDIRVGGIRRSWWSVYVKAPTWTEVQRLAIPG